MKYAPKYSELEQTPIPRQERQKPKCQPCAEVRIAVSLIIEDRLIIAGSSLQL